MFTGIVQAKGEQERADALMKTAVNLMPADPGIQMQAASHAIARGNLEQAMEHWSRAMETDTAATKQIFPVLLKLAEDPRTRLAFRPFAASPPSWWEAFFAEMARGGGLVDEQ